MGSAFSFVSSGTVLTVLVVAVGFAYQYYSSQTQEPSPNLRLTLPKDQSKHSGSLKKKSKKKQVATKEVATSGAEEEDIKLPGSEPSPSSGIKFKSDEHKPPALSFPTVVPGGFGGDTTSSAVEQDTDAGGSGKQKKKKKKAKSKKAGAGGTGSSAQVEEKSDPAGPAESSSLGRSAGSQRLQPQLAVAGGAGLDDSEAWTRVESKRKPRSSPTDSKSNPQDATSDAGITTSVTGTSSPMSGDEAGAPQPDASSASEDDRRTLAGKLIPKPRKVGVEGTLEEPDQPPVARVLPVQPSLGDKPAPGFSWADYEDVRTAAAEHADGEDDGGWGVVKSRSRNRSERPSQPDSQPQSGSEMTKKQRQNAAKREAQKAAKAEAEAQRLATLAKHKRELEKVKIAEQYSQKSGGSSASVNDKGQLVWD